ncbi:MAG: sigma-70 family RNA polymerase sigma factor [Proteobacteria bacterium]|nr:MAG: sigma-70 family RNA polymerase sigma factor [Pseudomonadota bacterium]
MTLAQAGDETAYGKLLREISAYVKAIVRKKLDDPARADDVTQDILLAIHKARHTYDSSRPFVPWLHAILRFRLTDQLRKIYAGRKFEDLDLNSTYGETFSDVQTNEEIDGALIHALDSLPEKQRMVVKMLKLDGLSVKEAAQATGMTESALKVSAHRAYKAMRGFLSSRGGNDA